MGKVHQGAGTRNGMEAITGEPELEVYRWAVTALLSARVPFLVGGAYALGHYTPIGRNTKDLDLFLRRQDAPAALAALAGAGFQTELPFPHWLGKARWGTSGLFVDVIFSSGNGVAAVDDEWFTHAPQAEVMGLRLPLCPPEEMIWSKAFVFERERFDGADVMHLLRDCGERLDWARLLRRFGRHHRVLHAHLILFGYVFPDERARVPAWVMQELADRLAWDEARSGREIARDPSVCQGTLLSREQYLVDIEQLGYGDARILHDDVGMTADDVSRWTEAIPGRGPHVGSHHRGDR